MLLHEFGLEGSEDDAQIEFAWVSKLKFEVETRGFKRKLECGTISCFQIELNSTKI